MNSNPTHFGFKVLDFLELLDWKVMNINQNVPMTLWLLCPACGGHLKTICTFVGREGLQKLRAGCCPKCGYLGYIDRPAKSWMDSFYFNQWDKSSAYSEELPSTLRKHFEEGDLGRKTEMVPLIKKMIADKIDKEIYVCEIGCGMGQNLQRLKNVGFKNLVGVEASSHRADIAKTVYNLNVLKGPFEAEPLQRELKKYAPFGLIFAYHVLEHTYNPGEIIGLSASLQEAGGYLNISIPNFEGEVSMVSLAFLPHLHAFTKAALVKILSVNGYKVIYDGLSNDQVLNILARKTDRLPLPQNDSVDYFNNTLSKFVLGLRMEKNYPQRPRRLWWYRKFDAGGQSVFLKNASLESIHWGLLSIFNKFRHYKRLISRTGVFKYLTSKRRTQSLLIKSLDKRYTSFDESPLEIQLEKDIKLFYK